MSKIESILEENIIYETFADFTKQANINPQKYNELIGKFQENPKKYWADLAADELNWFTAAENKLFEGTDRKYPFSKVVNDDKPPFYKWFEGGKINISFNCIDRHLKEHGGKLDDKLALIWEGEPGDSQRLTYRELHDEVCRFANALKSLGIKKGDVVTIYMPLCPQAIIAMHASNRIGAIHSVVFGGFSSEALRDRVLDGKSKLVITADALFRKGNIVPLVKYVHDAIKNIDHVENVICFTRVKNLLSEYSLPESKNLKNKNIDTPNNILEKENDHGKLFIDLHELSLANNINALDPSLFKTCSGTKFHDWGHVVDKQSLDCKPEMLDSEDISFILYTSGSTGKPKGVQHCTAGYLLWTHLTSKWVFDLKKDDIYWCTADVGWITGHSYVAYGPLSCGATCFIYEGAPNFPKENRFWDLIERHKVTVFYTAPTAIRAFEAWGLEHIQKHNLSSLRLLGTVGEPINPKVWLWYFKNIGKEKCPIVDTWWQTETGGIMITTLPGVHSMVPGHAGLPLPGINADITEEGLLVVKSPWPSMLQTVYVNDELYLSNYWRSIDAEKSSSSFLTNTTKISMLNDFDLKKQNIYLAGDGAAFDQHGYFEIMGRIDDVINVSGHRLGTQEIESALVSHEMISEAAVVSVPHQIKGEGIIAYVVLSGDAASKKISSMIHSKNLTDKNSGVESHKDNETFNPKESRNVNQTIDGLENEFKNHITQMIGAIARPEKIIICSALPKTRSGKIMRRLLRDIARGKKPSGDISTLENSSVIEELMKL